MEKDLFNASAIANAAMLNELIQYNFKHLYMDFCSNPFYLATFEGVMNLFQYFTFHSNEIGMTIENRQVVAECKVSINFKNFEYSDGKLLLVLQIAIIWAIKELVRARKDMETPEFV